MNKWIDSRNQMPPDRAPVWVTHAPDQEVLSAVFYKGERIDMGSECFYWRVENRSISTYEHFFWQPRESAPESMKPEVRGSVHEANKARWVYSQFATPFEFNKPFWVYDEKLGVRLATLVRLVYGDEELPHQHGSPVFLDWETGAFLKGRRWYMDLLYPVKPS